MEIGRWRKRVSKLYEIDKISQIFKTKFYFSEQFEVHSKTEQSIESYRVYPLEAYFFLSHLMIKINF